jgi:Flp pilus assembly CpaF family ATPase
MRPWGSGPWSSFSRTGASREIMVVDPQTIFIERKGKLVRADARFTDDEAVRSCIERIVTPLGRRIDESTPARGRALEGRLARQRGDQAAGHQGRVHHDP